MKESMYQKKLVRRLEAEFPGCIVIRNDPRYVQGLPDLLILYNELWAMLEVKTSEDAPTQPNQAYYIGEFSRLSYCSFIYPDIEERIFFELHEILDRDLEVLS